ncbi:MAG: shikimate kinase [Clostridia bacterium]|nr:shikimate kinase [Clostridia bacterium]
MNNLIFIGMPSSGKSTLGRLLAKELGRPFLDTDDVIRQINGCELHEIMDRDGLQAFLDREVEAIRTVNVQDTVIATGGSAIYSPAGMEHLQKIGKIVYVKISYETLEKRVGDPHLRGVVLAPGKTLRDLYEERVPLYEKYADLTLDQPDGETTRQSVARLLELIK